MQLSEKYIKYLTNKIDTHRMNIDMFSEVSPNPDKDKYIIEQKAKLKATQDALEIYVCDLPNDIDSYPLTVQYRDGLDVLGLHTAIDEKIHSLYEADNRYRFTVSHHAYGGGKVSVLAKKVGSNERNTEEYIFKYEDYYYND